MEDDLTRPITNPDAYSGPDGDTENQNDTPETEDTNNG